MKDLFRAIWINKAFKEFVLYIVSSVAALFAFMGLDLLTVLNESTNPLKDTWVWLTSFWVALVVTIIKQTVGWLILKAAKLQQMNQLRDLVTKRFIKS